MTSLTIITGSISDVRDPAGKLDESQLYYTTIEEDIFDERYVMERGEEFPLYFTNPNKRIFDIVQDKGSGKTLKGIDILSRKAFTGGNVAANLGLIWHNPGVENKDDWKAVISTFEDFKSLSHCTVLIDDVKETIKKWNTNASDLLTEVSGGGRKQGRDDIYTGQREIQIPPEIREQASEWIVPVIRIRDNTRKNPDDGTGMPIELITLHFNNVKVFKYMSRPIIGLNRLFECYSTIARAINLGTGGEGARPNQPGYQLEAKAFDFLKAQVPGMNWQQLNGKFVFDIVSDVWAVDVCDTDPDGKPRTEFKDLTRHIRTAKRKGQKPYLMFPYHGSWGFVPITYHTNDRCSGKRIDIDSTTIRTIDVFVRSNTNK